MSSPTVLKARAARLAAALSCFSSALPGAIRPSPSQVSQDLPISWNCRIASGVAYTGLGMCDGTGRFCTCDRGCFERLSGSIMSYIPSSSIRTSSSVLPCCGPAPCAVVVWPRLIKETTCRGNAAVHRIPKRDVRLSTGIAWRLLGIRRACMNAMIRSNSRSSTWIERVLPQARINQ